jgi:glycosyltransferase involved in cell wall biosynthesis
MASAYPKIPVTVIVNTRNNERYLEKCLRALEDFDEVIVLDSNSTDCTREIANNCGVQIVDFNWNAQYPKKRQWALDNLQIKHDWVFFVDADEIVTPELADEIRSLDFNAAGYFVKGVYLYEGKPLRFGLANNKISLLHRNKMVFPILDDLHAPMGEIEGHYQPVLKSRDFIGQLKKPLWHDACDDRAGWQERHERYAAWEREMNSRKVWPADPKPFRNFLKQVFRSMPFRPIIAFFHCYVLKLGILDGKRGFRFARDRYRYYRMI